MYCCDKVFLSEYLFLNHYILRHQPDHIKMFLEVTCLILGTVFTVVVCLLGMDLNTIMRLIINYHAYLVGGYEKVGQSNSPELSQ